MSRGDHRLAMLLTGSYFLAGLALLMGVNAERGRNAALFPGGPDPSKV
jgi:UMF1 family MFS transporter